MSRDLLHCHTWAVVACWNGWEKSGFSLCSLLACFCFSIVIQRANWTLMQQIYCCVGRKKSDTGTISQYYAEVWQQSCQWQWEVLNSISLQLGDATAHGVVSLHFNCADSNVESKLSCFNTAFVSRLELMNKCFAHTAVSNVDGRVEGQPGTEWLNGPT